MSSSAGQVSQPVRAAAAVYVPDKAGRLEDSQPWGSSSGPRDKLTASKGSLAEYIVGVSVADSSADSWTQMYHRDECGRQYCRCLNTSMSRGCMKKVPKYFTYFILYTFSLTYILYWQYFNMQYFVCMRALSRVHKQAWTDSRELLASLPTCVQTS